MRILTALLLTAIVLTSASLGDDDKPIAVVGKSAPDFEATGIDGKKFKLSDKIGKKNIVLMFSRAYW